MAHNPVNHPLRPLYRAIGAVAGAYLVLFGIVGLIVTAGDGLFGTTGDRVLGQGTNLFWSIVALVLGVIVLAVAAVGRNLDTEVDKFLGWGLLVVGSYGLAVIRTDANFLDFSIATVVITYLVGLLLIMTGLYSKVARTQDAGPSREEREAPLREATSA
jgi:Domain of unknown function (DUF4383)